MRFIVDVNVGRRIAEFLAQEGHDVVWVGNLGQEMADRDIMARSLREQRNILTVDHRSSGDTIFIWDRKDCERSKVRLEISLPTAMRDVAAKRRKRRKEDEG